MFLLLWILLIPGGLGQSLVFTTQPSSSNAYATFSVVVEKRDSSNALVTGDSTPIYIGLDPSSVGTTYNTILYGTLSVSASTGSVSFPGLSMRTAGTSFRLFAIGTGYTKATSNTFTITSAVSNSLYFSTQPLNSANPCTSGITVQVLSPPLGKGIVNTAFTSQITLTLVQGQGYGTMTALNVNAVSGQVTFNTCAVTGTGTFFLKASSAGLTDAVSNTFTISTSTPATVTFNSAPTSVYKGYEFAVSATVTDSNGNRVLTNSQYYLQVKTGSGAVVSGGSTTLSLGTLAFSNVVLSGTGSVSLAISCSSCPTFATTHSLTVLTYEELIISFDNAIMEGVPNQSYEISLSEAPLADVKIAISSKEPSSLELLTSSLTFTTSNWNSPQTVSMNAGLLTTSTYPYNVALIHTVTSDDESYNGVASYTSCLVNSGAISVPIYGVQRAYVQVDYSVGLRAKESTQIYISIGKQPTSDVFISLALSNSKITLSSSSVSFTNLSWGTQKVTLTGPSTATSPYENTVITYTIATTDVNYSGSNLLYPRDLTTNVVIIPQSTPSILVSSSAILISTKSFDVFDVRLSAQPTSSLTMTVSSSSTNLQVSPSSLTFSTSNYKVFQQITIYAINSTPVNPSTQATVTLTVTTSSINFSGVSEIVAVTISNLCVSVPYAWPNGPSCTCPAGFDCRGSEPVPCPPGSFSPSGQIDCTACDPGQYCPDPTASSASTCTSGQYSYEYYTYCASCPGGYACSSGSGYNIQKCVQGTYAGPGSNSCTSPGVGEMAPGPEFAFKVACPSGFIISGNPDICVPCPAGVSCSAANPVVYTECAAGTYSMAGMSTCVSCPNDSQECDPFTGPTRICPEGTYRASSASMCSLCPAGSYCSASESTRPVTCATGLTSVEGSAYCKREFSNYPGLSGTSTSVSSCTSTTYSCFVGTYTAHSTKIICNVGWGWCYPIPPGEDSLGTLASSNKFSFIGSNDIDWAFKGFNIPDISDRPDMHGYECSPGKWCGSNTAVVTACGEGKFNDVVRAYDINFCFNCPPGYSCASSTGNYEAYPCAPGKYCPSATGPTPVDCPAGTFNKKLRGIAPGSCAQCPEGYTCGAGTVNPTICPTGKICPIGSGAATNCPEGTYNPVRGKYKIEDCLLCPAGHYCQASAQVPVPCDQGTYNPYQGSSLSTCWTCPAGYACPGVGTVEPVMKCEIGYYCTEGSKSKTSTPCPTGTIGSLYGAYGLSQCDQCPAGFACSFAANYVNNPPTVCSAGYYCPLGTQYATQYPCPKGTYNARTRVEGLHECLICPAGKFCPSGTPNVNTGTTYDCPAGYYCPRGTTYSTEYPCPAGTYTATTPATGLGDCSICPIGKFCPLATSTPVSCQAGTYMDELGATDGGPGNFPSCKKCPAGYYSSSTGAVTCTLAGNMAAAGKYTNEGAVAEQTCVVGYYCKSTATSELMMYLSICPAGFLCPAGMSSYPTLSSNACPQGKYCPEGTESAQNCPAGKYRNTVGAKSVNDCKLVPAGFYVSAVGTSDYSSNLCTAGYYCPAGSIVGTSEACPKGTYRSLTGGASADDCAACPPGTYCANTATTIPTTCPQGSYCPSGTITPLQCPSGTYGAANSLMTSTDCTTCPAGKYCQAPGLTAVTGDCQAGFFCSGGATTATPTDGQTGDLCPAGGYCLAGASSVTSCAAGFFNNFKGGRSSTDCVTCLPGYYCSAGNLNASPTGLCNAGYYCIAGQSSATAASASAGYYAPQGSVAQVPCQPGTYNPSTSQSACLSCNPGKYCPTTARTTELNCPAGLYCIQGSFIGMFCPAGTYKFDTGTSSVDDCDACTENKYCLITGQTTVTGDCAAGYYCLGSSPYPKPYVELAGYYGPCPIGYYCLGTAAPTVCPLGTFNPSTTASSLVQCLNCPAGYACNSVGQSTYTGISCRQGYFCTERSSEREPTSGKCPAGSACVAGSAFNLLCSAGTYQLLTGQSTCKTCPPGYFCPPGTGNYADNICLAGYYCPSGTSYSKQYPCPIGTYNPNTGQQSSAACIDCSPGSYCSSLGASAVTGLCDAGFYCISRSTTARPYLVSFGGRCTPGYYCPIGSSDRIACGAGNYCSDDELALPNANCSPGYYCTTLAITPTPTDGITGNICSNMFYCSGSSSAVQCSAGFFLPYNGASLSSECITCTPGYYCNGNVTPMRVTCTAGYYCPGGNITPTLGCERGYYCPTGSAQQILCAAGTYQSSTMSSSCLSCTAGYYCELGADSETLCPMGYWCGASTTYRYQNPCNIGYYNSVVGQTSVAACTICDPGKFCDTLGASLYNDVCDDGYYCKEGATTSKPILAAMGGMCQPGHYCPAGSEEPTKCEVGLYCGGYALAGSSGSCLAGYFCLEGSALKNPTDGTQGDKCGPGTYCPTESSEETPCPAGTYSPSYGLADYTECLDCTYGMFCNSEGLTAPAGECLAGFYCEPGKTTSTPPEGICPTGHYCGVGSSFPTPCPMGQFNIITQQSICLDCEDGYYCTGSTAVPANCPVGYECPAVTRYSGEFPCGAGKYADVTNLHECKTCPAGRECNNAAENANNLCPQYKFCEVGTGYGEICLSGTYNKDSEGLTDPDECSICPSGQFCVDGRVSGQCGPGFWCKMESSYSTPTVTDLTGTPCPAGYYCGLGTTTPSKCPDGKFRRDTGATQVSDCTECPPGSYCVSGNPTPFDCPKGYYCPRGVNAGTPCPMYTYNGQMSKSDINACKPCPAGYMCDEEGIGDFTEFPCEFGYFCVLGAKTLIPCPPGTYGASKNARRTADCPACPGGYYCEEGTIDPLPCTIGTYCPRGSSSPIPCTPGFTCDDLTDEPVPCERENYCPQYDRTDLTKYYNESATIECPIGTVCPGRDFYPNTCRPGTYISDTSCIRCPAGFYSDGTSSGECTPCHAGYLCVLGANKPNPKTLSSDGGYPCPAGYYCPEGTTAALECPVTTYNPKTTTGRLEDCLPCPADTYGDLTALSKCKLCGSHAYSLPGSDTCLCTGLFRNYQKYDGSCICLQTYEFISEGETESELDSNKDCSPIEYDNCIAGQSRKADGSCASSSSCTKECDGGSGSLSSDYGVCVCDSTPDEEVVCNSTCRASLPTVTMKSNTQFLVYNPNTGRTKSVTMKGSSYLSSVSISSDSTSKVYNIEMTSDGPQAVYGVGSALEQTYRRQLMMDNEHVYRELATTSEGLSNPLACIRRKDTFLFSLTPRTHYPVYLKDSLLNTNKNFDYSAFKELAWRMKSSESYVDTFAFTFVDAGIYNFVDNDDSSKHIIIAVVGDSENCPKSDVPFLARSTLNMNSLRIATAKDYMKQPQWGVIAGIIVAIIILTILIIGFLAFLHWRAWASVHSKERLYAMLKSCCKRCKYKSNLKVPVFEDPSSNIEEGIDFDKDLLEPSQFTDMYDNLCKYYDRIKAAFDAQEEEASTGLQELLEQAKELKDQLADKLGDIDPDILRQKIVEAEYDEDEDFVESQTPFNEIEPAIYSENIVEIIRNETANEEKRAKQLSKLIQDNPDLLEQDKQELISELNANMQRLDQLLNADIQSSQSELNKRLQDRAAKRRAAQREKAYYEPKKAEIIDRQKEEREILDKELKQQTDQINNDYISDRDAYKKESRKEVEQRLMEIRSNLQSDLANAQNQQEIDALMKNYEIESKRIEDQLNNHKKSQEAELMKRLEERRKNRLTRLTEDYDHRKTDLAEKHQDELTQLERNNLLAFVDGVDGIEISQEDQNEIDQVGGYFESELEKLEDHQRREIVSLDESIEREEADIEHTRNEEKQRLKQALENAGTQTEKDQIMRELNQLDEAMGLAKGKQESNLKLRLLDRKRKRAEKEAELKMKHEREKFDLELQQKEAKSEVKGQIELRKMEEILENAQNMTPEELIGLARQLLESKHDREISELVAMKHAKIRERQNTLIEASVNTKAIERADLRAIFNAKREDLKKKKLPANKTQAEMNELDAKEKEAQNQLEFNTMAALNAHQDEVWRDVEEEFRHKFNDLASAQMQENSTILRKIAERDPRIASANLSDMENDIEKLRSENERLHAQKLRELDARAHQLREFERQKEHEISALNDQLHEVEEKQRKLEEIQDQRRIMEERQRMMIEVMKERGISPEQMEALLKKHEEEMKEWDRAMDDERDRQKSRLQAKLDERKARYQEKISSQIQKYKEENLKLIEQQDKAELEKVKILATTGVDIKIWEPKEEIETQLRFASLNGKDSEKADMSLLDQVLTRVRRVEKIAENVDTSQFEQLMKAFKHVNEMISKVKKRI